MIKESLVLLQARRRSNQQAKAGGVVGGGCLWTHCAGLACCVAAQAHVVDAEMQDMGAPERLAGRGRPLAADFAGAHGHKGHDWCQANDVSPEPSAQ